MRLMLKVASQRMLSRTSAAWHAVASHCRRTPKSNVIAFNAAMWRAIKAEGEVLAKGTVRSHLKNQWHLDASWYARLMLKVIVRVTWLRISAALLQADIYASSQTSSYEARIRGDGKQ